MNPKPHTSKSESDLTFSQRSDLTIYLFIRVFVDSYI